MVFKDHSRSRLRCLCITVSLSLFLSFLAVSTLLNFIWLPFFFCFHLFYHLILVFLKFFLNAILCEIVKAGHTEKHKIIKCLRYEPNIITQVGIQPETFATGILMSSGKRFPSTLVRKVHGHVSITVSVFGNNTTSICFSN